MTRIRLYFVSLWVAASPAFSAPQAVGPAEQPARFGLVALTDPESSFVGAVERALRELTREDQRLQVKHLKPDGDGRWTAELLEPFDGFIVIAAPGGETAFPPSAAALLKAAVRDGKSLAAFGAALPALSKLDGLIEILGAGTRSAHWGMEAPPVVIRKVDRYHPAAAEIPPKWLVQTVVYRLGPPFDPAANHVILALDPKDTDFSVLDEAVEAKEFAVTWARIAGKGRVLVSALGGDSEIWGDGYFRGQVRWGLLWCAGRYRYEPFPPGEEKVAWELTASGLKTFDVRVGEGPPPKMYQVAKIFLHATKPDGAVVRSVRPPAEPITYSVGMHQITLGIEEAVMGMRVGGVRKVAIPPHLAQLNLKTDKFESEGDHLIYAEIELLSAE